MTTRVLTLLLVQGSFMLPALAQNTPPKPDTPQVVPWPHLREADVMWSKYITRVIDVREKQNQCMQWPKNPLNVILYQAVKAGNLIPYRNDSLTSIIPLQEFLDRGSDTIIVDQPISETDIELTQADTIITPFDPLKIKKFRIYEEWIFDKKLSTMYVRIIAIAPMYILQIAGIDLGEQDLCVLKYSKKPGDADPFDVREILVNQKVFNRQNDAARISFDDWFEQRLFSSYIIKEENAYDYKIRDFDEFKDNKVGALLESERIKQQIFETEHDMWEY